MIQVTSGTVRLTCKDRSTASQSMQVLCCSLDEDDEEDVDAVDAVDEEEEEDEVAEAVLAVDNNSLGCTPVHA